jgi:murein L,D-transpeptidase YafK
MKITFLFILSFLSFSVVDFKSAQLKYPRVKESYQEKEETFKKIYQEKGVEYKKQTILIRVFKSENELELWVKNISGVYSLLKTYDICNASGGLGPKRKAGDYQVPEGFYHIDRFNPQSSFYLSLGLNYPNSSDKILSDKKEPGGDIFIHGNCVSIGCMAMTDSLIKELYIAAVEARNGGQNIIPVHIYPFRMSEENMARATEKLEEEKALLLFWLNLKTGYDFFEKNKQLPSVLVDSKGNYIFRK